MKVCFLFGSGADTDAVSSLPAGQSFSEALICNSYKKEISEITGIDASNFKLLHHSSSKIFVQTIYNNQQRAKEIIDESVVNDFVDYYKGENNVEYKEKIAPLCKEWYRLIMDEEIDKDENNVKKFFLENAVLFDSLDEKFNSLRDTNYNSNAKRVINAYYSVFLLMFKKLYNPDENFKWNLENIYLKLQEDYTSEISSGCYYELLKESNLEFEVITTNYTYLATRLTNKEAIYLHGKMNWFEDLENLMVLDCLDKDERLLLKDRNKVIPFILIPSGVKPLICKKQIDEFSKFIQALKESNYLVVVGYKFNSEDNHINSIIAEWLRKPANRLIYLNYKDTLDFKKIRWSSDFAVYNERECKNIEIRPEEKIINISINKDNARENFVKVLAALKRNSASF